MEQNINKLAIEIYKNPYMGLYYSAEHQIHLEKQMNNLTVS